MGLAFIAVRQTQSILATDAALAPARPELNLHRLWRPLLVLAGCVAGVILALALSAAGERFAGATTVPVAPATPVLTAAITAANATVTTTAPAIDAGAAVIPPALADTVATVKRALPAVASSLLPAGTPPRVPSPLAVGTLTADTVLPGLATPAPSATSMPVGPVAASAPRTLHTSILDETAARPLPLALSIGSVSPTNPSPLPVPQAPMPGPIAGSTVASDTPASQGGGPLGAHIPLGLALPTLFVIGVGVLFRRPPRLLLDLRYSRPG